MMNIRSLRGLRVYALIVLVAAIGTTLCAQQPVVRTNPARIVYDSVSVGRYEIESYRLGIRNIQGVVVIGSNDHSLTFSLRDNNGFRRRLIIEPTDGFIDQTVYVKFSPRIAGDFRGEIFHISREFNERHILPVLGTVYENEEGAPIVINPRMIDFGEVPVGEHSTEMYGINTNGLRSRLIIRSNNPQVSLSFEEEGEFLNHLVVNPTDNVPRFAVYVRYSPRVAGPLRAVVSHHIQGINIQIPLQVTGQGIGDNNNNQNIVINPRLIDFGRVQVGQHSTESYVIQGRNIDSNLTVVSENPQITLSLREDGEYFNRLQINPVDGIIRQSVYVRYSPRVAGPLRAVVLHNVRGTNIQIPLQVTGMGLGDDNNNQNIVINPRLIDFGRVQVGQHSTESYVIQGRNIDSNLIVVSENPQITLSLREDGEYFNRLQINPVDGIIRQSVYVRYSPRVAGPLRAVVLHSIRGTNIQIPLQVTGMGIGDDNNNQRITFNPRLIDFGRVQVGQHSTESYIIHGRDIESNLIVFSVNPQITLSLREDGEYSNRLQINPVDGIIRQSVYVRFAPRVQGPLREPVTHRFMDENAVHQLMVTGYGVENNNRIVIDPERIDFGRVAVGATATSSYTISAVQDDPIAIFSTSRFITISLTEDGEYSANLNLRPVNGGIRERIFVRFSPRIAEPLRATINHRTPTMNAPIILTVVGTGIEGDRNDSLDINEDIAPSGPTVLLGNYPNPFNPSTTIRFYLEKPSYTTLTVYDLHGRKIKTLIDNNLSQGIHHIVWEGVSDRGESVSSGVYFYVMRTENVTYKGRMILLK